METKTQLTAVEWLYNKFSTCTSDEMVGNIGNWFEQAKAMEKEQIKNAFQESRLTHPMIGFKHETFEQYYNETFKSEE